VESPDPEFESPDPEFESPDPDFELPDPEDELPDPEDVLENVTSAEAPPVPVAELTPPLVAGDEGTSGLMLTPR
jgi:hypothetical protein